MKIPQTLKRIFAVLALSAAACTQDPPAPPTAAPSALTGYDEAPRINSRAGPGVSEVTEITVEYNFGGSVEALACDPSCSGASGGVSPAP